MMTVRSHGRFRSNVVCLLVICGGALVSAQATPQGTTVSTLSVAGDVRTPLSITAAELKAMPRTSVDVKDENGRTVKYEGVLVGELLKRAGATLGGDMRGNAMTTYVLASASDGYQVLFSLAELDPAFTSSEVIVADSIDGKPLLAHQGPFRMCPLRTRVRRAPFGCCSAWTSSD